MHQCEQSACVHLMIKQSCFFEPIIFTNFLKGVTAVDYVVDDGVTLRSDEKTRFLHDSALYAFCQHR